MRRDAHESAADHVSGRALYTHDLAVTRNDILHAWPVQHQDAHADIEHVDTRAALSLDGVHAVLTAADVPGTNDVSVARGDEPLFPDQVQYAGQPVAWVIAETEDLAREAAARVTVHANRRAPLVDLREAIDAGSFSTEPQRIEQGAVDATLRDAPYKLQGELFIGGQEHFYLETQAAYAQRDEAGQWLVHSSTQHPSETQTIVARVLGVPNSDVVCQSLRMGGAFGGKEVQANAFAAVAALAALRTGRAVSVRLDRFRDMQITGGRHPFLGRYEVGFDDAGSVLALDVRLYSDGGYSLDLSEAVMGRAVFHVDNCYRIPNLRVTGRVVRTHTASNTAMRGFGGPQAMVLIEDVLDQVARHLGKPVLDVRKRNFYRAGDRTHYGQEVRDADRIGRIVSELEVSSDFDRRRCEVNAFNAQHRDTKRGLALTPVKFGISFTASVLNQAGALVLMFRDGSVQLNHGGTEMGQGLHTKMRQVAARTLGMSPSRIRLMPTRTDKVPNTSATAASAGSDLNGGAVRAACETLLERLRPVAAEQLGCNPDDVRFEEAGACHGSTELTWAELAESAYKARVALFATGYFATPGLWFDRAAGRGEPFRYFAFGAAVSEVEVDGFTGLYTLRRVDILHDVGDSLAPLIDLGQIEGGFMQGVGYLTCEQRGHDSDGRPTAVGASTYKLPGAAEAPDVFNVQTLSRASEPRIVLGSKAVGEPPLMLAISVREALRDAAAAFRGPGPVALACPSTPEAVYWALTGDSP